MKTLNFYVNLMNKLFIVLILGSLLFGCAGQFNKGITNKRELRSKKPPSVQIAEGYDKGNKKKAKTYSNPKKASKARAKHNAKVKKRGDKYLKKKRKKQK